MKQHFFIWTGPPASGKTLFACQLENAFGKKFLRRTFDTPFKNNYRTRSSQRILILDGITYPVIPENDFLVNIQITNLDKEQISKDVLRNCEVIKFPMNIFERALFKKKLIQIVGQHIYEKLNES